MNTGQIVKVSYNEDNEKKSMYGISTDGESLLLENGYLLSYDDEGYPGLCTIFYQRQMDIRFKKGISDVSVQATRNVPTLIRNRFEEAYKDFRICQTSFNTINEMLRKIEQNIGNLIYFKEDMESIKKKVRKEQER